MLVTNIIKLFRKDNFRILHISMLTISIFVLLCTFFIEYVMELAPCPLCIYQRFPYLCIIKISVTGIITKKNSNYTFVFILMNLLASCLLSIYHSGIEREIFVSGSLCSSVVTIPKDISTEEIVKMFYSEPIVTCSAAPFRVLTLSMTEWNFLLNFGLLVATSFILSFPLINKYINLDATSEQNNHGNGI